MISNVPVITDAGKSLLIRALGGEQITFTRFKIGNGELTGTETAGMTDLINPLLEFPINKIDTQDGFVKLSGSFDNASLETAFRWRELGVYCRGEDGNEVLYAYSNEAENAGLLSAYRTNVAEEHTISVIIAVGDAENVTAVLSESAVYASREELEAHLAEKNPHRITKEDTGLGNVPNVATNDQTPTYNLAAAETELKSGEKLSTAFGKIARAVKSFIAHISNTENPHKLTCSQLGAAKTEHTHSTTDLTSGTLSIARGGTGASTAKQALANLGGAYTITSERLKCKIIDNKTGLYQFTAEKNCKGILVSITQTSSPGYSYPATVATMIQHYPDSTTGIAEIDFYNLTTNYDVEYVYFYITQICEG